MHSFSNCPQQMERTLRLHKQPEVNCRSHQEEEIMQLLSGDEEFVLQAQRCVFKQTNPCEGPFKSTMCLLSGFLS